MTAIERFTAGRADGPARGQGRERLTTSESAARDVFLLSRKTVAAL